MIASDASLFLTRKFTRGVAKEIRAEFGFNKSLICPIQFEYLQVSDAPYGRLD